MGVFLVFLQFILFSWCRTIDKNRLTFLLPGYNIVMDHAVSSDGREHKQYTADCVQTHALMTAMFVASDHNNNEWGPGRIPQEAQMLTLHMQLFFILFFRWCLDLHTGIVYMFMPQLKGARPYFL